MCSNYNLEYARDLIPAIEFSWTEVHNEVVDGEKPADRLQWCLLDLSRDDYQVIKDGLMWRLEELWKEFPRYMQYAVWEFAERVGEEGYETVYNRPFPSYLQLCGHPLG